MAINPRGDRLYGLLKKTVNGDPAGTLRINEFDIDQERYASKAGRPPGSYNQGVRLRKIDQASPTCTTSLPKFLPSSRPMNASGAFSSPGTICSRYLILPSAYQVLMSWANSS